jgi:hypothetical protein
VGLHAPDDTPDIAGAAVDLVEDTPGVGDVKEAVFGKRRCLNPFIADRASKRDRIGEL